jgi:hypothetical protein
MRRRRRFTVVGSRRMATFDDMALEGGRPRSDGASGPRVVRVLEALQRSLDAWAR